MGIIRDFLSAVGVDTCAENGHDIGNHKIILAGHDEFICSHCYELKYILESNGELCNYYNGVTRQDISPYKFKNRINGDKIVLGNSIISKLSVKSKTRKSNKSKKRKKVK